VVTLVAVSSDVSGDVRIVGGSGTVFIKEDAFAHFENGAIADLEPSQGVGGAAVFIYGGDLRGQGSSVDTVTFGDVATTIVEETNFYVRVQAADGEAGDAVDVTIVADTGATIVKADAWTYVDVGNVTELLPSTGAPGTNVIIFGTNMLQGSEGLSTVTLNGVAASILSANDTHVIVEAGLTDVSEAVTGDVVITSADGSTITSEDAWTYIVDPDIHSVTPSSGQGGTLVTIKGVELIASDSLASVTLAGVAVREIISENNTQVVIVAGSSADSVDAGDVVLTSNSGVEVVRVDGWQYFGPGNISFISPEQGQIGTIVSIAGTGMLNGGSEIVSVTLAGSPVGEIVSSNDTLVVVKTGANISSTEGLVELVADSGADLTSVAGITFEYQATSTVDSITPDSGYEGTIVTIVGSNMRTGGDAVVSVTLNDVEVASIVSENDTHVIAIVADATAGTGHVVVTADVGGSATLEGAFTYIDEPEISVVSPDRGQLGTNVAIHGVDLFSGGSDLSAITLSDETPFEIIFKNSTLIMLRAGESGTTGVGDIVIISDTGSTFVAENAWTYDVPSNITDVCV
jgi:aspartate 1-decarboxylase